MKRTCRFVPLLLKGTVCYLGIYSTFRTYINKLKQTSNKLNKLEPLCLIDSDVSGSTLQIYLANVIVSYPCCSLFLSLFL